MFSLNRISFCLLLLAFTSGSASEIQMDNDTLSLISLYNFSSNSLRAGFEPFYLFTNFFIDNLFEPHIPQEIKQAASNSSLTKFADQVLEDYGLKSSWFQDLKFSSIVLPGLVNFIIISMFVSIFVPIVGFCICSYRTCCRGKFSPFDHKFDTYKRKLYSFILFILLIASVIGTVIVFFTGQNTMLAFKNFPKILNSSSGQIDDFSRQEIPRFFSQSNEIIDQTNSEAIIIFNNTLKKTLENSLDLEPFFEVYTNELSPILNKLHSLYVNLTKKPNNSSNASQQAKELIDTFENIKISMIEKFKILNTIKSENFDQNSLILLMREKSSEIHSNFIQNVNNFVKKIKDEIGDFNNYIEKELAFFSSEINSEQNHEFLKLSVQYYHYFYYVLLGASVFMLSLFILHSLGLAGMCSRRMHNNHKQSCHRGISANFFLAGTAFYFLFAFFLIVLCVIMFVPGITFRQVVCKPTFELEDNHIFQIGSKLAGFDKFLENSSVRKIVYECDQKNSSKFFNSKLKQFLDKRIGESTSGLIESFKPEISKIDFGSISKSIEKFESHILQITEKINNSGTNDIFNQNIFDGLLISINNFQEQEVSEAFKSDIEDLKEFRQLINDSETKEAFENLLDQVKKIKKELKNVSIQKKFGDSLENTLSSFTLPEVETLKETKIQELLDAVPSCQILSNLYQSLTLSVCYEFIDNFNTFWTTLYALIILFFVICCFAFVQADLLRKYYRYDELLEEDIGDEKSSAQFDLQRQRSSRANSGAIDAYEMKGYNHAGMKYPSNRSPPSTRNTRA